MRPSQILAAVVAFSSATHAISMADAFDNIHGLTDVKEVLFGRQNNNENNNNGNNNGGNNNNNNNDNQNKNTDAPASTQPADKPADKPTDQPTATNTGDNNNNNNNGNKDGSTAKETGTNKPSGTKTQSGKSKSTSFDPRLPAGGLTMVTPNAMAGTQYYKVGDWVTFAWNYTSLSVTPTAIDVLASCTANQATYTISVNMSATQTEVLWNTGETPEGQAPFLTENYKLLIYDSDLSATAPPRAGYLGAFTGFTFGMYLKQPYTPLSEGYRCPNCNGALSHFEKMTLSTMLFTTGTTIGSLLYFTYQFGLW